MKKTLFFITVLVTSILAFTKEGYSARERARAREICLYLMRENRIGEDHLCNEDLNNNDILDELIDLGIFDEVHESWNPICTIPPPPGGGNDPII